MWGKADGTGVVIDDCTFNTEGVGGSHLLHVLGLRALLLLPP